MRRKKFQPFFSIFSLQILRSEPHISETAAQMSCATNKRHNPEVSAFHWYHWFGSKLFPVGCSQHTVSIPSKPCFFDLAPPTLRISGKFCGGNRLHMVSRLLTPRSCRSVGSKWVRRCVTQSTEKKVAIWRIFASPGAASARISLKY